MSKVWHNCLGLRASSGRRISLHHTVRNAKRLGLTGYAKNLDDGSVEVVACGEEGQVEKINAVVKEWRPAFCACRTGAQRAASSLGELTDFRIR